MLDAALVQEPLGGLLQLLPAKLPQGLLEELLRGLLEELLEVLQRCLLQPKSVLQLCSVNWANDQ